MLLEYFPLKNDLSVIVNEIVNESVTEGKGTVVLLKWLIQQSSALYHNHETSVQPCILQADWMREGVGGGVSYFWTEEKSMSHLNPSSRLAHVQTC